jgi:hypothetical protein
MPQHSAEPTHASKLDVSKFYSQNKLRSRLRNCFKFPRAENRALYKDILISFKISQYLIYAPLSIFYASLRPA